MKGTDNRISREDIEVLDQEFCLSTDTDPRLDPQKLRMFARCNPDQICYPVARGGGRSGVSINLFRKDS